MDISDITNVSKKILLLIYTYVIVFMLRRIFINYIDKQSVYGSDYYMTNYDGKPCYCAGVLHLHNNTDEEIELFWQKTKINI